MTFIFIFIGILLFLYFSLNIYQNLSFKVKRDFNIVENKSSEIEVNILKEYIKQIKFHQTSIKTALQNLEYQVAKQTGKNKLEKIEFAKKTKETLPTRLVREVIPELSPKTITELEQIPAYLRRKVMLDKLESKPTLLDQLDLKNIDVKSEINLAKNIDKKNKIKEIFNITISNKFVDESELDHFIGSIESIYENISKE